MSERREKSKKSVHFVVKCCLQQLRKEAEYHQHVIIVIIIIIKPMTDARETRTRNSHKKLARNRTCSI